MEKKEVKEKLIKMLDKLFPNSEVDLDVLEYVDFIDDLGMDSITFISIVIEVEEEFDIVVPDTMLRLESFKNVGCIIDIVENAIKINGNTKNEKEEE